MPLQHVGVKSLSIYMPGADGSQGPSAGSTGLAFTAASRSSVKDVSIINADTSISLTNVHAFTVSVRHKHNTSTNKQGHVQSNPHRVATCCCNSLCVCCNSM